MAKRKKSPEELETRPARQEEAREPVLTHTAYKIAIIAAMAGLLIQLVLALIAYPNLPASIPRGWIGWLPPVGTLPKWIVFVAFPGAQLVVTLLAWFTQKDDQGRRVMESGKTASLVLLTMLFTALQSSLFTIPE